MIKIGGQWRTLLVSLALTVSVLWAPSGAAAAPAACPAAYPVEDISPGMLATGYTVSQGTTPQTFVVVVRGVLHDGIAPGIDMIIVDTDSPDIRQAGGIWAGMSGSPVYAADGRLLGAIAYGLSGGPSAIGGITPAAAMYEVLGFPNAGLSAPQQTWNKQVPFPASMRRGNRDAGLTRSAPAGSMLSPLLTPIAISGLSAARINQLSLELAKRGLTNVLAYPASSVAVGATAPASSIVPGGNFAAALSVGDVTTGGIGTTTAVCGGKALAFGHPFTFGGAVASRAHTASALYVQPDSQSAPFKVANVGGLVGTLDQDRLAGIRATLGGTPASTQIRSTVSAGGTGLTRTGVTVASAPNDLGFIAASHLLANLDRVFQKIGAGSTLVGWTVDGTTASGRAFRLDHQNRYASSSDASTESTLEPLSQIQAIIDNPFVATTIDSVALTASTDEVLRRYSLSSVTVKQEASFVAVRPGDTIEAPAGGTLEVRAVLSARGADKTVTLSFPVASSLQGMAGSLNLHGGGGEPVPSADPPPASFDELLSALRNAPRNDTLRGQLRIDGSPQPQTTTRSVTQDQVVTGDQTFNVVVIQTP